MRKSATEIINDLEMRIAKLEGMGGKAFLNLDRYGETYVRNKSDLATYIVDEGYHQLLGGKLFIKDGLGLVKKYIRNPSIFNTLLKQELIVITESMSIGDHRKTSGFSLEEIEEMGLPDTQTINKSKVFVEDVVSPRDGTPGFLIKINNGAGL